MSLDSAVDMAVQIFDDFSAAYLRKYHSRNEEVARKFAEGLVSTRYDDLTVAITSLLHWVDGTPSVCEVPSVHRDVLGQAYEAVEFQGRPLPRRLARRCEEEWEKLALFRKTTTAGMARDALCAAMAAISSRAEQSWLDSVELESEWKKKEKSQPRWRRRAIFEKLVQEALSEGARGHFVNLLLHPVSTYRVALGCKDGTLSPASLLVTLSLPMCRALKHMDHGGPLCGKPAMWRRWPAFALQDLLPEEPEEDGIRFERVASRSLQPEPALRAMIRSPEPVVMLDAFAALAPRAEARELGLSLIVKAELDRLFREAKSRRQGVVFMLGGDDPESLARKVYLKPPFTNYGMRVGYLRWRKAAKGPWAREKHDRARLLIGVQVP